MPVISAGVMIANFSWNIAKTQQRDRRAPAPGAVAPPTPRNMKNVRGSPMRPPMLSPKARLKPTTTQIRLITPSAMKLWSIVEMTFLMRTMPP